MPNIKRLAQRFAAVQNTRTDTALIVDEHPDEFQQFLLDQEQDTVWEIGGEFIHWEPWMGSFVVLNSDYHAIMFEASEIKSYTDPKYPGWLEKVTAFYRATHQRIPTDTRIVKFGGDDGNTGS